jgi:hypothetical protein
MSKLHNLGLFARFGGPFDRVFFILSITGDSLIPDDISSLIGLNPTKSYKKGDQTISGAQYRKTGAWILDSGEIKLKEDEFESAYFLKWIRSLPESSNVWKKLNSNYEVVVRLVGYTNQMNADFEVTLDIMGELTARNLNLAVEPYLSLDEGDDD